MTPSYEENTSIRCGLKLVTWNRKFSVVFILTSVRLLQDLPESVVLQVTRPSGYCANTSIRCCGSGDSAPAPALSNTVSDSGPPSQSRAKS